jgi:hypothetical protein
VERELLAKENNDLSSAMEYYRDQPLLEALQNQLLGMEEKAEELIKGDVSGGSGNARTSSRDIPDLAAEDKSPFAAGPSVAAVIDVACALESKLEVRFFPLVCSCQAL